MALFSYMPTPEGSLVSLISQSHQELILSALELERARLSVSNGSSLPPFCVFVLFTAVRRRCCGCHHVDSELATPAVNCVFDRLSASVSACFHPTIVTKICATPSSLLSLIGRRFIPPLSLAALLFFPMCFGACPRNLRAHVCFVVETRV